MAIKDDMEDVQEAVINELITDNGLNPLTVGDGQITTAKIADGAVGTAKIADGAVGTAKIADSSITASKLAISFAPAQGSLSTGQLADGAVTRPKIADDAVTTAKIDDGAVTPAKLSQAYLPLTGGSVTGNVGIGTSSIDNKVNIQESALAGRGASNGNTSMTIEHATDTGIQFFSATQTQIRFGDAASTGAGSIIYQHATDKLRLNTGSLVTFEDGGSERMRIDSSGNVLVGKTATDSDANGVELLPNGTVYITANNTLPFYINRRGGGTELARFANDGSTVGSISVSGSATAYNTSSDYRLKTDAQPMTGATARLKALNPVNFEWIADGTRVDGFLAHEAQEVVAEAVTGTKDALDEEGNPEYQGIDQSKLVPLLTKALQEALTKIESLEARVASLENT